MAEEAGIDGGTASWYLVQYTADLRKREPRNVGVLLHAGERWLGRFFAETEPGKVNGHRIRRLQLVKEPYEAWISYYRRKLSENRWEDVERAQRRRPANFTTSLGGKIAGADDTDWGAELEKLFADLVAEESTPSLSAAGKLKERAAQLFRQADITVERDVPAAARFGEGVSPVRVPFDFSFMNGQLHLAEAVSLGGWSGESNALAFNARANAVRAAGTASSFLALYDSTQIDGSHEDVILAALEGVANTVDMAEADEAVETLREIAHHD